MAEMREMATGIANRDLRGAAIVFAAAHETFSARDFAEFLHIGAYGIEEEAANDLLGEMVSARQLREIGPGRYARVAAAPRGVVNLEEPLWPEEAGR